MAETATLAETRAGFDASAIAAAQGTEVVQAGELVWRQGEVASEALLLVDTGARLFARAQEGQRTLLEVVPPFVAGVSGALWGRPRHTTFEILEEGCVVRISPDLIRDLLAADTAPGAAFRRLLVLSMTRGIRTVNGTLAGLLRARAPSGARFDPDASGSFSALRLSQAAEPDRVREMLERAGVSVPDPMELGLSERTYPAEVQLARTGEVAREAFLVAAGRVRVSMRLPGGGHEVLAVLGPGQLVGEMALVDGEVRAAHVVAHEGPVTVFVLGRSVFQSLLAGTIDGSAPLVAWIAMTLARRFDDVIARTTALFRPPAAG